MQDRFVVTISIALPCNGFGPFNGEQAKTFARELTRANISCEIHRLAKMSVAKIVAMKRELTRVPRSGSEY